MKPSNTLKVSIVENASDATRHGFFYRPPIFKPIAIEQVVVVKKGTVAGKSTVDLILQDEHGQKYVVMLTGKLLRSIPTEFGDDQQQG